MTTRPTLIVVGDYYLLGETDDSMEVKRLIREYAVNSKCDLDPYIQQHPGVGRRQAHRGQHDVGDNPGYLHFKTAIIVYIGYLSGMGAMKDWIFAGSRFARLWLFLDSSRPRWQHHRGHCRNARRRSQSDCRVVH